MTAWWRAIVVSHRWLGIAGWLVFIMWLATGIVMMYARMPAFSRAERFATLAPLDLSDARLSPSDALRSQRIVDPQRVVVAMLTGRPVYRVLARGISTTVFADNGEPLDRLSPDQALDEVRRFAPESAATIIDNRASRARAKAAVSMILRSRAIASAWLSSSKRVARGSVLGSAE